MSTDVQATVDELVSFYGESDLYPSREQWHSVVALGHEGSITIVNFIKFRETASYEDSSLPEISGIEAMMKYAEISQKSVAKVGGEFVAQGLSGGILIGDAEDWDSIGIVRYPSPKAFIDLFTDPEYRQGHHHRAAASAKHKMCLLIDVSL